MKYLNISMVGLLVASAMGVQGAEIIKLSVADSGNYYMDFGGAWDGGAVPGSGDVAVFNSTSVPGSSGDTFRALNTYIGGYKITDIQGNLNVNATTYNYGFGVDMSAATADVTFENLRNNAGGGMPITVAAGRTFRTGIISTATGKSAYNMPISGGGTVLVNGSATASSARMMFNVSGAGTTVGGNGTWAPYWANSGYGMQIGSGSYIAPGDNGIGTMTLDDTNGGQTALVMADGSGLKMELGAAGASDMLALTAMAAGDVSFLGTTVIDLLGTGEVGTYKLFDTDLDESTWNGLTLSGQDITGGLTVANLASGLTGTLYMGNGTTGDSGDIYLDVIPEPATLSLIAVLGGGMLFIRRRFMI